MDTQSLLQAHGCVIPSNEEILREANAETERRTKSSNSKKSHIKRAKEPVCEAVQKCELQITSTRIKIYLQQFLSYLAIITI